MQRWIGDSVFEKVGGRWGARFVWHWYEKDKLFQSIQPKFHPLMMKSWTWNLRGTVQMPGLSPGAYNESTVLKDTPGNRRHVGAVCWEKQDLLYRLAKQWLDGKGIDIYVRQPQPKLTTSPYLMNFNVVSRYNSKMDYWEYISQKNQFLVFKINFTEAVPRAACSSGIVPLFKRQCSRTTSSKRRRSKRNTVKEGALFTADDCTIVLWQVAVFWGGRARGGGNKTLYHSGGYSKLRFSNNQFLLPSWVSLPKPPPLNEYIGGFKWLESHT